MNIRLSAALLVLSIGLSFAADPRIEQGAIFEAKGEYEMALGEYRAILAEQPQNSEAYFLAAEVYMKMPKQDLARALANYRLAYKFTPTMSKAYEGAAKVYRLMGQKAKAEEELAKDPKNKPAEAAPVEAAAAGMGPVHVVGVVDYAHLIGLVVLSLSSVLVHISPDSSPFQWRYSRRGQPLDRCPLPPPRDRPRRP